MPEQDFLQTRQVLEDAFRKGDTNEVMKQLNIKFGKNSYSIWHLFRDEQKRLLRKLLGNTWGEIDRFFRHIYEHNYSIMVMMRNMNMNLPKELSVPAEFVVNQELGSLIRAEEIDVNGVKELADTAEILLLQLDQTTLRYEASAKINDLMKKLDQKRDDIQLLTSIENALDILNSFVPDMNLQTAQNLIFTIGKEKFPEMKKKAAAKNKDALIWVESFEKIAGHLGLNVE